MALGFSENGRRVPPGITADWLYWGETRALTVETLRRLQSAPRVIDRRRLNRLKNACIKADEKGGATSATVLRAIRADVPDATVEEISAVIEELSKEGELALRLSKLLGDNKNKGD